jgi:hypothetical protein
MVVFLFNRGEFLYKATMALATSMSALPILVVHKPPRVRGFIGLELANFLSNLYRLKGIMSWV